MAEHSAPKGTAHGMLARSMRSAGIWPVQRGTPRPLTGTRPPLRCAGGVGHCRLEAAGTRSSGLRHGVSRDGRGWYTKQNNPMDGFLRGEPASCVGEQEAGASIWRLRWTLRRPRATVCQLRGLGHSVRGGPAAVCRKIRGGRRRLGRAHLAVSPASQAGQILLSLVIVVRLRARFLA